jgi:hypothetical protein
LLALSRTLTASSTSLFSLPIFSLLARSSTMSYGYRAPNDYQPPGSGGGYSNNPPNYSQPSNPAAPPAGVSVYRWWIPSDGIRRDVIQADIQRYLGQDALVKPGLGTGQDANRNGYWIAAYRNLTTAMVADLRSDSANFELLGARGNYQNSQIHQSRQYYGPTAENVVPVAEAQYTQPTQPAAPTAQRYSQPQQPGYAATASAYGGYGQPAQNTSPQYPTAPSTNSSSYGGPSPVNSGTQATTYGTHYTHGAGSNAASSTGSYPSTPASNQYSDPNAVPRTTHPDPRYATQHATQPAPQTYAQPPPSNSGNPPAGYYLASDGNYYLNSHRRQ